MSHVNYVSNVWDGCANVHMKQLGSLYKRTIKLLMPNPTRAYKQKCSALKLLRLDKHRLFNNCVLMQKVVHGRDQMLPSGHLNSVHGYKQLLPRTRIDIFKTNLSFSGSLAFNLSHHLRTPMKLKTFRKKIFQQFLNSL